MADHSDALPATELSSPLTVAIRQREERTLHLVSEALNKRLAMLAFQPVVQAARPDEVAFYEGLIRIADPQGRIIPARDFVDEIEEAQLGREMDTLALELGLQALCDEPGLRLSVNMSARSIGYPRWADALKRGIEKDPTVGERLILEITERSAIIMPDIVQVFMADLHMKGVSFALDEFGTGYTAFRHLKNFYFDIMKIGGVFIRDIHATPDNQVLTGAFLSLAKHFDMFTVAEGVETLEDAEFLSGLGVDCLQGYFFGAPTIHPLWRQRNTQQHAG